ncbi:DUF4007 family protein [[Actinomadura] parvosata]|uniref:DUF4007 family protein n=1 Tax=[Actinomadura] parvosata TaxID=1955412 RepID=UPI00406CDD90
MTKFSGHESFACRYAWLPKAYRELAGDPDAFADEDRAMVQLGVGKNMVRSIRFWVEVMGVAVPTAGRSFELTPFGRAVLAEDGFDPYLEDARTLWLLHWNISTYKDPLFAWQFLLFSWPFGELTRSEALTALRREAKRLNAIHSDVTLGIHLDVFLHTYIAPRTTKVTAEQSLDSPLAELELLHQVGERRADGSGRREPSYAFRRESKPEVTKAVFEYCLDDYWRRYKKSDATITFRDAAMAPFSVGQVFKLPEDDVRSRLDAYVLTDSAAPFRYQPSAVQGLIFRRDPGAHDFLAAVYAQEADYA